jgi:hypothetical protein
MPRLFLVRFEMILGDFRPGLLNALVGNIYTYVWDSGCLRENDERGGFRPANH